MTYGDLLATLAAVISDRRAAQGEISRRIVALLDPTVKAPALSPEGPQEAEVTLLPTLP
jgi:hypothetical protein